MKAYGRKWERLRAAILKRDGYQSQLAKRYGKRVSADTVHHILPVENFPEYMWSPWNLISISSREHNRLHDRKTHRLTKEGIELAVRTAVRRGLNVADVLEKLQRDTEETAEE